MKVIRVDIHEGWNLVSKNLFLNEQSLDKAKPIVSDAIDSFLSWQLSYYDDTHILKYKNALPKIKSFDSLQADFENFSVSIEYVDVI